MEVVTFSVLSAVLLQIFCIISYVFYKRYKASTVPENPVPIKPRIEEVKLNVKKLKQNGKKAKQKKNPPQQKKKPPVSVNEDSDTESYTTEEQLVQTIISQQQFAQDSINTAAVNAKPTIKKPAPTQRSNSKSRKGVSNSEVYQRDPDWENVIGRKKKKLYPVTKRGDNFEFTLDEEGGIVETQLCEISFPAESVKEPTHVSAEVEKYRKFVDETEEKVFVTPAVHFTMDNGDIKLHRQFTMKLNTMKLMGRGWNGNVCCQIETKDSNDEWVTTGRTEYLFGKPVQIVGDELSSFRVVITRGQNGSISRDLQIAAYIAKPKMQNPTHHFVHLCIFDKSQQSQYKVDMNMQNFLLKMQPRICNVPFGSNVEFKIQPTQKFTPESKDVFMRWTEVCKAFVNVRFQIRLNRNESENPNFEAEFRTVVFLNILKVKNAITLTQEEYFHFYWISATLYPKKRQKSKIKGQRKDEEKVSEDDGFASGSDIPPTPEIENPPQIYPSDRMIQGRPPIPPQNFETAKKKRNRKKAKKTAQADDGALTHSDPRSQSSMQTKTTSNPPQIPVQSSVTKDADKPQMSTQVKRDIPTPTNRNIDNKSQKNNQSSNVQSSGPPPRVPPQKGNPHDRNTGKPPISSKNNSTPQSMATKTQENPKGPIKTQYYVQKPTVSGHQDPNAKTGPQQQRRIFRYRSPSKKGNRGNQSENKKQEFSGAQPSVTNKKEVDKKPISSQPKRPENRPLVTKPPAGGDAKQKYPQNKEKQVRPQVTHQRSQDTHDRSQNAKTDTQNQKTDPRNQKTPKRQYPPRTQERNQQTISKQVNHAIDQNDVAKRPQLTKKFNQPPMPKKGHLKTPDTSKIIQNGPTKDFSLQKSKPVPQKVEDARPMSQDSTKVKEPAPAASMNGPTNPPPKDRRPRNRYRQRGPPAVPQTNPVKTEAT